MSAKIRILNIPFDAITEAEAIEKIRHRLGGESGDLALITTPNPEMLLEAQNNPAFRDILNNTWMSIPDGIGILWAGRFAQESEGRSYLGKIFTALRTLAELVVSPKKSRSVFPQRLSGVDLMQKIVELSQSSGERIFLLGAAEGVAEKAGEKLLEQFPKAKIVGYHAGSPADEDYLSILRKIRETEPEILFVAYGAPAQEEWLNRHRGELTGVRLAMGVGGSFDFIAGTKRRAPLWMRLLGLEWAFRLAQEPTRYKRIWNAVVRFPLAVLRSF